MDLQKVTTLKPEGRKTLQDTGLRETIKKKNIQDQEDKDREFFKLTLLSQLMNHPNFARLKDIDKDRLYYKAMMSGVAFH